MPIETVGGKGMFMGDLISLLQTIRTKFVGVTAKLDLDSGVTGTNFASLWNFAAPDPNQLQVLGMRDQGVLLDYLKTIRASYAGLLAKLDLDGGVADTDYASLNGITAVVDVGSNISDLNQAGLNQGALSKWLSNYLTAWNATLAKLDLDGTVNDTDYNSLWKLAPTLLTTSAGDLLKV